MTQWNFSLANYDSVWRILTQIGILLIALFVGNMLRTKIPLFRKALIPSALIGGIIVFIVNELLIWLFDFELVNQSVMQVVTYHGLGIGFVAMALKNVRKEKTEVNSKKAIDTGVLYGAVYMLQAVIGLGVTILLWFLSQNWDKIIFYASGILLPLGFGQGPGNALTWDVNYSADYSTWFNTNGSFGLSIASIGFIVASVVGIIYINIQNHRGNLKKVSDTYLEKAQSIEVDENEIPDSESVDKFSIQLGFVAIAYGIAFGFMCLLGILSDFTNSLAWGFNFLWGTFAAYFVKAIYKFSRRKKLVKREFINNYHMDRISGFAFDIMIVAGVASIRVSDVSFYVLPLIILCVLGTVATFAFIHFISKKVFNEYRHETFTMAFGTLTGTASNGLILLKQIDPSLKTPVSSLYVLSQFPQMVTVAPILLLVAFAGKSLNNAIIALAIFFVLFVVYTVFLLRRQIFKKKVKVESSENVSSTEA